MKMTVGEVAEKIGAAVQGDASVAISGLAGLREAGPGEMTFMADPRYARALAATRASALMVAPDWAGTFAGPVLRVHDVNRAMMVLTDLFGVKPPVPPAGVHPSAVVAPGVRLGAQVSIGPFCVLEPGVRVGDRTVLSAACYLGHDTVVGADCRFYPHVTTREGTCIGDRVIIHNGTVVGSDGFGYTREGEAWKKIPQLGHVEIGDDVELGANVTIDRARFGKTVIGNGVKIDNLVQVAHNVRIGENTAIAAQTAIAGSTIIGRRVQLGGQVGVSGHIEVGDDVIVAGGAGVTKNARAGTYLYGMPAMPHDEALKLHAYFRRLPEMRAQLLALTRQKDGAGEKPPV